MTETIVRCQTNRTGFFLLRPTHGKIDKVSATQGVIETENGFANVLMAKISKTGRMISPGTLVRVASHIEVLPIIAEK